LLPAQNKPTTVARIRIWAHFVLRCSHYRARSTNYGLRCCKVSGCGRAGRNEDARIRWGVAISIENVRLNPRKILVSAVAVTVGVVAGGAVAWGVQEFVARGGDNATVMAALGGADSPQVVSTAVEDAVAGSEPEGGSEGNETGAAANLFAHQQTAAVTKPFSEEVRAAFESGSLLDLDGLLLHISGVDPFAWRPAPRSCDGIDRGVVVDRATQRGWFCIDSAVGTHFVLTSSDLQPDPGDYAVYAKDINAWSWEFGPPSTMTHFVAFTRGKFQGARIAFHSVPKYRDGSWAQPLESVGTPELFGASSGCIRLLPEDAVALWDFIDIGGTVRVIS
jgi:hypothetical protein